MGNPKIKVLYITGTERCGSTVMTRVLGHNQGFLSAGECQLLWRCCAQLDNPCSCGDPFGVCVFWHTIFQRAYGGFTAGLTHQSLLADLAQVSVYGYRRVLTPWAVPDCPASLNATRDILIKLYETLASTSNSHVIIDSTKRPDYALLLSLIDRLDVYVVHVVRDSRAFAFSTGREKVDYVRDGTPVYMNTRIPRRAAKRWVQRNLSAHMLNQAQGLRYLRVRYEDFAVDPKDTVRRIGRFIDEDVSSIPFVDDHTVDLQHDHLPTNNPMRFQRGPVTIRPDNEWRGRMKPSERVLVTALTLPLLQAYGYQPARGLFSADRENIGPLPSPAHRAPSRSSSAK